MRRVRRKVDTTKPSLVKMGKKRILHDCSCFIEFIKPVEIKK